MNSSDENAKSISVEKVIASLYRAVLLREPEEGAINHWTPEVENRGFEFVLSEFLKSKEFGYKIGQFVELYPFDRAHEQIIETEVSESVMGTLWDRVSKTWTKLGSDDPYFSVLSDPRWSGLSESARIEAFYSTGEGDLRRMDAWLARNGLSVGSDGACVEYGCGVGRFTEWLTDRYGKVAAFDVSESHLELARARGRARKIADKVDYLRVSTPADLAKLGGARLFYSVIVLQHNPPPIIAAILDAAFAGLNPGGIAFFQVPTRGNDGYRFRTSEYLENGGDGWMEMHAIDQGAVFRLAARHGLRPVEVSPDYCSGGFGISTTFLMQKE